MQTEVPGLLVAGEAVGGANGANRLSGNAITEALVFGRRAGRTAAERANEDRAARLRVRNPPRAPLDLLAASDRAAGCQHRRHGAVLAGRRWRTTSGRSAPTPSSAARSRVIDDLTAALGSRPIGDGGAFDMRALDWFDLRNMLTVARVVTQAALARTESRGAHQREDFPGMLPEWHVNQVARLAGGRIALTSAPVIAQAAAQ